MCSSFFQMAVPSVGVHYLLIPLSRLAMFSCVYTGMYGSESTQNIISTPQHPTISECTLDVYMCQLCCSYMNLHACGYSVHVEHTSVIVLEYASCTTSVYTLHILVLCCMCTYRFVCV